MDGPEGAGALVAAWLTTRIPARLRLLEARLDMTAGTIVDPARVLSEDTGPIAIEDWPSVYVLPQRLDRMDVVDVDAQGETYACRYVMRVLMWVRASTYADTELLRRRYVLATREALLERKQLRTAPTYGSPEWGQLVGNITVDPASIREDYGPMIDDEGRTIAGAFIDLNVLTAERMAAAAPLGLTDTVEVDTAPLPPHPGL